MNLVEQFNALSIPVSSNDKTFNAATVDKYSFAKIGVNNSGFPILLISSIPESYFHAQKNIRLKYLELTHNLKCSIVIDKVSTLEVFTVIVFKSNENNLKNYFISIAEVFLKELSNKPTQEDIHNTFSSFIEIFRSLSTPPKKTIQGLWSELFIIANSANPSLLLRYWHEDPEDRFDFNADCHRVEVKSSNVLERVHYFTSSQLNPPLDKMVIIASIFTKSTPAGKSIVDLLNIVKKRLDNEGIGQKLYKIISKTLGSTLEEGIQVKYDYDIAKNSLRFYNAKDIAKVSSADIPKEVSGVTFRSDLTDINDIIPKSCFRDKSKLFEAL